MRTTRSAPLAAVVLLCLAALPAAAQGNQGFGHDGLQHLRERLYATDVAQSSATRLVGSAQGFTPFAAEDAVLLLDGLYALRGREAIAAHLLATPLESVEGPMSWEPLRWDVSADGTLGYTTGRVWLDAPQADGSTVRWYGRYVSVWKRGPRGTWALSASLRDLFHPDAPGPGPLPELSADCAAFHETGPWRGPVADPAPYVAEVFATDAAFAAEAVVRGTPAAFYTYAADDKYTPDAGGICGRGPAVPDGTPGSPLRWAPELGGAAGSGDLAWTAGPYHVTNRRGVTFYGKYLSIWVRSAEGPLRFILDQGSGSPGGERL